MKVGALRRLSLVDYPGRPSAVIFTQGCPWRCVYCHNAFLLPRESSRPLVPWDDVRTFLEGRRGLLQGVVFCGGEPTLQEDLAERAAEVQSFGFAVKLDTNGSDPKRLAETIPFLSYVAMDLKAPFGEAYDRVCGVPVDQEAVKQSLELLRGSKVPYHLRTTIQKGFLSESEITAIRSILLAGEEYRMTEAEEASSSEEALD